MINLRYHIVSITAVFLALGIGITMGSTFLGRTALDQIDANVDRARRERDDVRAENTRLRQAVSAFEERSSALTEEGAQQIFDGRLGDDPVLLISAPGIDQDSLDTLRTALRGSGADFAGSIVVSDKFVLEPPAAGDLAEVLGVTTEDPEELRREATIQVADELLTVVDPANPPSTEATTTTTTTGIPGTPAVPVTTEAPISDPTKESTMERLVQNGFLDFQPPSDGADLAIPAGTRYVVVTGPEPDLPDSAFLQPLIQELARDQPAPLVVASAATGDDPEAVREVALAPLKQDESIGSRISTVNSLEDFTGIAAVILALDDLGAGRYGHYGVGDEVKSLLPTDEGG